MFADKEIEALSTKHKDALGDIGEAACMSILSEYGATLSNLNEEKRNHRGIDLAFLDNNGVFVERGGTGVVQVETRLRNPYKNTTYNRPERDRIKTPIAKIERAEHQAIERGAQLFWSIASFYPFDEDNVLLFFYLTTNEFMEDGRHCSRGDRYRYFLTKRTLQPYALRRHGLKVVTPVGILFRMRVYTAPTIREIKEVALRRGIRDTIASFGEMPFVNLKEWIGHPTNQDNLDFMEISFFKMRR